MQFVNTWQASNSPKEVMDKTGLSLKAIYKRVARLRKKGVPLKYFRIRSNLADLIRQAEGYNT